MKQLLKQNVGVDISKETFIASVCRRYLNNPLSFSKSKKFKNNEEGFKELLEWVEKNTDNDQPVYYLMEATGVYYEALSYYLYDHGCMIHVLLPNKSKNYFKSLNVKSKTDRIDSKYLSQFGVERDFPLWKPAPKFYKTLRGLTRFYHQLNEQKTVFTNMLHSSELSCENHKLVGKSTKEIIRKLEKEIKDCLKAIEKQIASADEVKSKCKNVCTIPGIGMITFATVIAETQGFFMFNNIKQLASFAGYDVVENQSGSSVNGKSRISKKGNKYIRKAMYFPALTTVRYSQKMNNTFHRIFNRRHIKMVSYVALQRKLLALIYTLWKKDEVFDETKVAPI